MLDVHFRYIQSHFDNNNLIAKKSWTQGNWFFFPSKVKHIIPPPPGKYIDCLHGTVFIKNVIGHKESHNWFNTHFIKTNQILNNFFISPKQFFTRLGLMASSFWHRVLYKSQWQIRFSVPKINLKWSLF